MKPRLKVIIDFETRGTCDLKKAGAYAYAWHPDTEVTRLGWMIDGESGNLWRPVVSDARDANAVPMGLMIALARNGCDCEVHAWNAFFEWSIWEALMVRRYGWPRIRDDQWRDIQAQALYHGYAADLDVTGRAMRLSTIKDAAGHTLMMQTCKPGKDGIYKTSDEIEARLDAYCLADLEAEHAICNALPPLPAAELAVWRRDQEVNRRGVAVDADLVAAAAELTDVMVVKAGGILSDLTFGTITSVGQTQRMRKLVNALEPNRPIDNVKKVDVTEYLGNADLDPLVVGVLEQRQNAGSSAVSKFKAMDLCSKVDGRIHGMYRYYGAHSGRWTSGRGVQIHNPPRECFTASYWPGSDEVLETADEATLRGRDVVLARDYDRLSEIHTNPSVALTRCVRPSLIAAPGCVLVASDLAGIEMRVLRWLAGDVATLKIISEHGSQRVYERLASQIFGFEVRKKMHPTEYTAGKSGELGCGYGMGGKRHSPSEPAKFVTFCRDNGVTVSDALALKTVETYRANNPLICDWTTGLWAVVESLVKETLGTGRETHYKSLVTFSRGIRGALVITLPSGRQLHYHGARLEPRKGGKRGTRIVYYGPGKGGGWALHDMYGGKFVENIVQAIARDILAYALVACTWPAVMHCHDEIVCEVLASAAEQCKKDLEACLLKAHSWAAGLPLGVESWVGKWFRK